MVFNHSFLFLFSFFFVCFFLFFCRSRFFAAFTFFFSRTLTRFISNEMSGTYSVYIVAFGATLLRSFMSFDILLLLLLLFLFRVLFVWYVAWRIVLYPLPWHCLFPFRPLYIVFIRIPVALLILLLHIFLFPLLTISPSLISTQCDCVCVLSPNSNFATLPISFGFSSTRCCPPRSFSSSQFFPPIFRLRSSWN